MTAWWVEVDGLVLPKPLAGHPGLELCNTRAGWGERPHPGQEYLRSYDHLVVLARERGVLPGDRAATLLGRRTPAARDEVGRARRLRADAYAQLTGAGTRAGLGRLARAAREARSRQSMVATGGRTRWAFTGSPSATEPLDGLVLALSDLLTSEAAERVEACPGQGCGWLFLDTSGRRRWCQMAVCGNRAKQAAFAARRSVG